MALRLADSTVDWRVDNSAAQTAAVSVVLMAKQKDKRKAVMKAASKVVGSAECWVVLLVARWAGYWVGQRADLWA